jgi:tetratricopeptide (TPR) repeat protein
VSGKIARVSLPRNVTPIAAKAAVLALLWGFACGTKYLTGQTDAGSLSRRGQSGLVIEEPGAAAPRLADEEAALFARIDEEIADKKLDAAEATLQEYLGRRPASAGALNRMGRIYFDRHDWARSASYLEQSVKREPHNDGAHLLLGLDYFQLKSLENAERELLTAVRQNPHSDENQYMAGRFFFEKFKRTEALSFFYQAVRLNPQNYKALHSVGLCFANLGSYAMAENYYKQAIAAAQKQNVRFEQVYLDLADLLTSIESARVPDGETYARQAVDFDRQSSLAHYLLGKALYREGRLAEALPELTHAFQLDPANGLPHFLIGKIYQKMGREAEAEAEWKAFHRLMTPKTERRPSGLPEEPGTVR